MENIEHGLFFIDKILIKNLQLKKIFTKDNELDFRCALCYFSLLY